MTAVIAAIAPSVAVIAAGMINLFMVNTSEIYFSFCDLSLVGYILPLECF